MHPEMLLAVTYNLCAGFFAPTVAPDCRKLALKMAAKLIR
jgi:hypothetical protein